MGREARNGFNLALRLFVGPALLACARVGATAGTWSVISLPETPGRVFAPTALTIDAEGNLYVAGGVSAGSQIQKQDARGNWSTLATAGDALGQVDSPAALAVDEAGNLYVADWADAGSGNEPGRIQKRDPQGTWSVIATEGDDLGQVDGPRGLAVDAACNLYAANGWTDPIGAVGWITKRAAQGYWVQIGDNLAIVPLALALDAAGRLFVSGNDFYIPLSDMILRPDAQGNWSIVATYGDDVGTVDGPKALAADAAGNLYVADSSRIQKRDAQGNWSVFATEGAALGQVSHSSGLAVDASGNLYVADTGNHRVQKYAP